MARSSLLQPPGRAELKDSDHGNRANTFGKDRYISLVKEMQPGEAAMWLKLHVQKMRAQHLNAVLLLSFMVLPTSSVTVLHTFHCRKFVTSA